MRRWGRGEHSSADKRDRGDDRQETAPYRPAAVVGDTQGTFLSLKMHNAIAPRGSEKGRASPRRLVERREPSAPQPPPRCLMFKFLSFRAKSLINWPSPDEHPVLTVRWRSEPCGICFRPTVQRNDL